MIKINKERTADSRMELSKSISLDYTINDLYAVDNEGEFNIALLYYPLQGDPNGATTAPKFVYQYELEGNMEGPKPPIPLAAKVVPQRYGFSAGKMSLLMPDFDSASCNSPGFDTVPTHLDDTYRVFSQVKPDQQPMLCTVKQLGSLSLDPGSQIAVLLPTDDLAHLPHLMDPEVHYEILSKRGLAMSGLPTPPSEVIDSVLDPASKQDMTRLKHEISRMIEPINKHKLPFMIKLPQSISGDGVAKVSTNSDRERTKELLTTLLEKILQHVNPSNHHLYPCSLVLQDFIRGDTVGLSLFVTKKGRPIFIACCQQRFDEGGHWTGGSISYREQSTFSQKYADISEKVATFLHGKGYYGPAGVDVITDESDQRQYIIDLNVRVTGTFHFGPLAGHFVRRGLFEAATVTHDFSCSRMAFEEAFHDEIENGSVIINGWAHESMRRSHGAITVGGRDASELSQLVLKITTLAILN